MSILLNKEQIAIIRELQKNLDIRVRENNDIDSNIDLNLEKYIALKTELFEFVNEVESFKYWKKNKGKSHILEEACDTLHFIFSLAIDNDVEIEQDEEMLKDFNIEKQDMNELIGVTDAVISDIYANGDWEDMSLVLTFLSVMIIKQGFTTEQLFEAYLAKNKVNHERQDNNY